MTIKTVSISENEEVDFLFNVYASTRIDEISAWGWEKDQAQQFLNMQYQCQIRSYDMQYPNLETRIIIFENKKIGRLLLAEIPGKIVIVDITLLPAFQNKGIGSNVLQKLLMNAKNQNKAVQLSVLNSNEQALRLYERLGFEQKNSTDMYTFMEWAGNKCNSRR